MTGGDGEEIARRDPDERLGRGALGALLVLSLMLLAFLWKPITSGGDYYAPTDLLQRVAIYQIAEPGYRPLNRLLADVTLDVHPWIEWGRSQLEDGRLPLWNPYNGAGAPHLGNSQSAIFSPFTLPFYLLPFRVALVVAPFLKMLCTGFFTYLFLRLVSIRHLAALIGATALMFGAYNLLWLSWPVTAALLPVGLVTVELLRRSRDHASAWLASSALAASVAVNFLVGHPETSFYTLSLLGVYLIARLLFMAVPLRARAVRLGQGAAGLALGVSLAAIQLVPFLEYLTRSGIFLGRTGAEARVFYQGRLVSWFAFPLVLGDPSSSVPLSLTVPNLNEGATFYLGLSALGLAVAGALSLFWRRRFVPGFFAVVAIFWVLYAYDVLGFGGAVSSLPVFDIGLITRSPVLWLMSASVLAAVGFDELTAADGIFQRRGRSKRVLALVVAGAALALLLAAVIAARVLRSDVEDVDPSAALATAGRFARDHLVYVTVTFLVSVGAIVLAITRRNRRFVCVAGIVVIVAVFAQTGWMFRGYNPTIEAKYFYPRTETTDAIARTVGNDQTFGLPPELNLWYRIHSAEIYDALVPSDYDALYRALLLTPGGRGSGFLVSADPAGRERLAALGIRYVITDKPYPFGSVTRAHPGETAPVRPAAGVSITDTIAPRVDDLNVVTTGAPLGDATQTCGLAVSDPATGADLATAEAKCGNGQVAFSFPAITKSAGRRLDVAVWLGPTRPEASMTGHIAVAAVSTRAPGLEIAWQNGRTWIFEVPDAPKRYSSPAGTRRVDDQDRALRILRRRGHDAREVALVEGPPETRQAAPGRVRVLSEEPTRVELRVTRETAGWLVARTSYFPGWRATVRGRSTPIVRADYAFSGIRVPAGTSKVVLSYEPASVRGGAVISALSLVVLLVVVVTATVVRGRDRRPRRRGTDD